VREDAPAAGGEEAPAAGEAPASNDKPAKTPKTAPAKPKPKATPGSEAGTGTGGRMRRERKQVGQAGAKPPCWTLAGAVSDGICVLRLRRLPPCNSDQQALCWRAQCRPSSSCPLRRPRRTWRRCWRWGGAAAPASATSQTSPSSSARCPPAPGGVWPVLGSQPKTCAIEIAARLARDRCTATALGAKLRPRCACHAACVVVQLEHSPPASVWVFLARLRR
jgi:hypothetical protein